MAYNKLTSLAANIEAIRMAHRLHRHRRTATAAERAALARYSGFGGIKEVLDIGTPHADSGDFAEPLRQLQSVIADIADGDETLYKSLIDSVKASVLTAFYTPQFLIAAVAKQIQATFADNSLPIRSFLEPSAGIGGFLPVGDTATHRYAIEKDTLTSLVLTALHPEADTYNAAFENIAALNLPDTTFDVIASNIPFGNFRVFDADFWKKGGIYEQSTKAIHNYFFIKALELLNDGGLLAFVTTRGIADTPGNKFLRDHLARHANLITALRLPDNLFAQSSGIEVGSDLLIWQKQSQKQGLSSREQLFLQTIREQAAPGLLAEPSNKLFTLPKTTLATESRIAANQFGKQVRKYLWHGTESALSEAIAAILRADFDRHFRKSLIANPGHAEPVQMSLFDCFDIEVETVAPTAKPNLSTRPYAAEIQSWLKEGALATLDGQVGTLRFRKSGLYADTAVDFMPMAISGEDTEKALDYLPLRDTYFELSIKEREEREEQPTLRERLNAIYDAFTAKWGCFHDRANRELILQDALGMEVFTIEMQQDGKPCKPSTRTTRSGCAYSTVRLTRTSPLCSS